MSAIQIPIPRPSKGKKRSGTEITRMRTRIVASEPSTMITRLSGTVAGSSMPSSRSTTRTTTARPSRKTSLPITPVCQPMTAIVGP